MSSYDHRKIEKKWQQYWTDHKSFQVSDGEPDKGNLYNLVEFPYPSGNLHIGHWYAFAVPDIYARAKRMQGYNVLFPIGFDAFGLPAENAAIKRKVNPREWTYQNIEKMHQQLGSMGASFDWSREVVTCDPEYYKWTQWMFLQFFQNNLAYQSLTRVNWCPSCKTVLANEQVAAGKCERCESEVEQKEMKQWQLKITDYAEKLLSGLDELDWPEEIKDSQRNWIGKSEGAKVKFQISNSKFQIEVFTTRPDTLFGATYMVLAPEHELISDLKSQISNWPEVEKYIKQAQKKTELERLEEAKEKTGVELKGVKAINPVNNEEIPIFIADYVLMSYGTGAIMAVPAHDERDWEFAKKFNLPIKSVVFERLAPIVDNTNQKLGILKLKKLEEYKPPYSKELIDILSKEAQVYAEQKSTTGEGVVVNSGEYDGLTTEEFKEKIIKWLENNKAGQSAINYRMRDWLVSRQRYWGCPIPVIYCRSCLENEKRKTKNEKLRKTIINGEEYAVIPVPDEQLPVELPEIDDYAPRDDGKSPLAKHDEWLKVDCPKCGQTAERESDTLDTFVDSSWYFLRYTDPQNKQEFASKDKMKKWLPINYYSGGVEHTTMHLLYSRFWVKAMHDLKLLDFDEPYVVRKNRGLIMGPDGHKMSKSKGNVVDPDEYVDKLGADTVRMYLAFIGPYNEVGAYPWDMQGIQGVRKFLDRVWRLQEKVADIQDATEVQKLLHQTIKKVTEDIEKLKFNTAVSQMMILVNLLEKQEQISKASYEKLILLLSVFSPHLAEELWQLQGNPEIISYQPWPKHDVDLARQDEIELVVQINGKVRDTIIVSADITQLEAEKLALGLEKIKNQLNKQQPKKIIFVEGRLINIVI